MIKTLNNNQYKKKERNFFIQTKFIYENSTNNIRHNSERQCFLLKSGARLGCQLSASIQHYTRGPNHGNKIRKKEKASRW